MLYFSIPHYTVKRQMIHSECMLLRLWINILYICLGVCVCVIEWNREENRFGGVRLWGGWKIVKIFFFFESGVTFKMIYIFFPFLNYNNPFWWIIYDFVYIHTVLSQIYNYMYLTLKESNFLFHFWDDAAYVHKDCICMSIIIYPSGRCRVLYSFQFSFNIRFHIHIPPSTIIIITIFFVYFHFFLTIPHHNEMGICIETLLNFH